MSPFVGIRPRADGLEQPRGRLFGRRKDQVPERAGEFGADVSITQAMQILERITERRAQNVGMSLGFADRIQLLP